MLGSYVTERPSFLLFVNICSYLILNQLPTGGNLKMHFGDTISIKCKPGYSLNQDAAGAADFTLVCAADGEFAELGTKV